MTHATTTAAPQRELPSVTQIMRAVGFTGSYYFDPMAMAAERGRAVHLAIALDDRGVLDESSVMPQLMPYLEAHRRARRELDLKVFYTEVDDVRMVHSTFGYDGRPDNASFVKGIETVLDWKSGDGTPTEAALIQCAAYKPLIEQHTGKMIRQLGSLWYRSNGTYTFKLYTDADARWAWHTWVAALVVYRAQQRLKSGGVA